MPWTLLLVDDSVTIRRVVELTFAGEDINVVAVGDGRQAMDRIVAEAPDIVLADVGLGEPDGYEVAAFVKAQPALRHVPVLLLTGAFQPVDQARAAACGCDGVLAKPFDLQSMVGVVHGLLRTPTLELPASDRTADPAPASASRPAPPADAAPASASQPASPAGAAPASASQPAPPAGGDDGDADALLGWWAALLDETDPPPPAQDVESPTTAVPAPTPAALISLDDYFDLVDEVLARPRETNGGASLFDIPPFRS